VNGVASGDGTVTYWFEGRDGADSVVGRDVVHCHTFSLHKTEIVVLLDAFERAVLRAEVECCGPVVALPCQHNASQIASPSDLPAIRHAILFNRSCTYLKSSLNVQLVQVLFATKSCSLGCMFAWKLFPPTI
jgi:hypothetical protein